MPSIKSVCGLQAPISHNWVNSSGRLNARDKRQFFSHSPTGKSENPTTKTAPSSTAFE